MSTKGGRLSLKDGLRVVTNGVSVTGTALATGKRS